MTLREFQALIREMYHDKDAARGVEGTFMWLVEEVGELASALRGGTPDDWSDKALGCAMPAPGAIALLAAVGLLPTRRRA